MNLAGDDVRGSVAHAGLNPATPRHLGLVERYSAECPEALMADGFDEGLIGRVDYQGVTLLAYDYWKCVQILMDRDGMDRAEAVEHMEFNVVGSCLKGGPLFIDLGI